jgi:glycogen(starch) synthase
MRIAIISNFYPPHYVGGYELGCRDVVEELKVRGHAVSVLTSNYGVESPQDEDDGIYRRLKSDFQTDPQHAGRHLFRLIRKEHRNKRAFKTLLRDFRPELIYVWSMAHVSISMVHSAQLAGLPICFFVSDQWLSHWETDAWYSLQFRQPRRVSRKLLWKSILVTLRALGLLSAYRLDLKHVHFVSQYLKQQALEAQKPVSRAEVIHWGVDVKRFAYNREKREANRLLYVGQIIPHKGIQTAVEAFRLIRAQPGRELMTLTIVGGPDYGGFVERLISEHVLDDHVQRTGLVPREALPQIYREHDILIFPSVWEEPFSITLLEAMACGLAVVATQTGGTPEILTDEVNALIFSKEDAQRCAAQILRLRDEADLYQRIRSNGRRTVEKGFRLESMIDKIERSLAEVIRGTPS